jgi:hypothetical protein
MLTVTGKFDGKKVVLDQVPEGIPADTPVEVTFPSAQLTGLDAIAAKARQTNLPRDFAAQHDHYVKGLPKR